MEVAKPTSFNTKVRREVVLGRIIEIYRKKWTYGNSEKMQRFVSQKNRLCSIFAR